MIPEVNIICTGMLDTKGEEIRFLANCVRENGANPVLLELSLGREVGWADIPLSEVLSSIGKISEDVYILSRVDAIDIVSQAGVKKVLELYAQGKVDGIISWAGSIGTMVATNIMRALPLGVPKVMLSTAMNGDITRFIGLSDIYMSHPISEKGINKFTKMIVGNGVAAVVSMAKWRCKEQIEVKEENRRLSAITLYGVTTSTAFRYAELMEQAGWDMLYFHQTGIGAAMEDLIRQGQIESVFDLTPGEIANNFFNSRSRNPENWKGERFTAAFDMGIPAIVAPGGMDASPFGAWEDLLEQYKQEFKSGKRLSYKNSGKPFYHSASTLMLPTTLSETKMLCEYMVSKFNKATGPALFIIPAKGWSAYDQSAAHATKDTGWSEGINGPTWIADSRYLEWSARSCILWDVLQHKMDTSNHNIDAIMCDLHILDPEFANLAYEAMVDMLTKKWRPGFYRDRPYVCLPDMGSNLAVKVHDGLGSENN